MHEIDRLVVDRMLIPVCRGVYRVGHAARSVEADYMAAVLACGDGALLAGLAGAHLLGIVKGRPPRAAVIVSAKRRFPGARRAHVPRSERFRWRGIPVTSPARTLVDLAAVMSVEELAGACHLAGVRHETTPRQVKAVLERRPNARGAAKFSPIFEGDAPAILSWMERRGLELVLEAGLPRPEVNRKRGAHYVDMRWPGLTVELNGYRYHHTRHAWEQDHERRRAARAREDEFRTYTYDDVVEAKAMIEEIRGLLGPP
ncbi:MAG TPA: hypothetical protein VJT75_14860 [Thermoleophilaceae bacterium]|nr:hypothetical protein [Thermoleophilaceae bacterium]